MGTMTTDTLSVPAPTTPDGLWTDAYKMRMAQMGWPLRPERFVLSFRRGGPWFVPLDLTAFVQRAVQPVDDHAFLARHGFHMDSGFRDAMAGEVEVTALPVGAWFSDHEPILTVSGPSARVSNLEARLIGELAFRIQVGTLGKLHTLGLLSREELERRLGVATCEQERAIVLETLAAVGVDDLVCRADPEGFFEHVRARAAAILDVVGDPRRVAEGGLRSATCAEHHLLAVAACRDAGWRATSNVWAARALDMIPVGTTGHEHSQRYGADLPAFRAAAERCPGNMTLLLDTYSTRQSGVPMALRVLQEHPGRLLSVRPDCEPTQVGDVHLMISALAERGLTAGINLSGGFDRDKTAAFLALARSRGFPEQRMSFLYGGSILAPHVPLPTRSTPSAVFKLCFSHRPTMKWSDGADGRPGPKSSKPGHPVVFRLASPDAAATETAPLGLVGQAGEAPPRGYLRQDEAEPIALDAGLVRRFRAGPPLHSAATSRLVAACERQRARAIASALSPEVR